ncbi:MAG: type IV secretion system protein TraC [Rickettsiaceae bacterium]|nr:type IV secretion system protein TraC [Rickettsiaceae bacterium]
MLSLNQFGEKIANLLGDAKSYGNNTVKSFTDFKKLTEYAPFAHLLPYQSYDESRQLFLNDQSIGFGLELMPLTGVSEDEINRLVSMFNDKLPSDGNLHIQLIASSKIGHYLDGFFKTRGTQNVINQRLALKRTEYYEKATQQSISKHSPFYLRDYRVFVYYSESITQSFGLQMDVLDNLREAWKTSISSMTVVDNLDIRNFMSIISSILNPSQDIDQQVKNYNKFDRITEQLINVDTVYEVTEHHLKVSSNNQDYIIQGFHASKLPEKAALWQTGENIGKLLDSSLQISCPMIINLHLKAMDKSSSKQRAQNQFMLNDKKARGPLARMFPSIIKKHSDWMILRDLLDGSERLAKVSYQVTLISNPDNAQKDAIRLRDLFIANSWELNLDKHLQLPSFLENLPFLMTAGLYQDLTYFGRFRTMTMFNAVNIMPLVAESKGTGNADGLMFVGRRGQVANWSNFANRDGNYNIVVAAKARSGKSFLMQEIISNVLCQGGIVRVIDLGRSYEKFCKLVDGQYVEMKEGVCINPFTHVVDINKSLSQIKAIIATMAHPGGDITDKELSFISNAITKAWIKFKNQATISNVIDELAIINDLVAKDLVILLEKFGKTGQFATYFEGDSTIDVSNPFIVLELEELKDKADLKSVVVLSIMLQITEEFYGKSRDIKKLCVIDEAWDLLHSSKQTAEFIEAGYRRVAKQNGAFATIVQSINDYFRNEMGIAIFENSDNQIILAQLDSTIENLKNNKRLSFTPYEERILRSFSGTGQYKECLIRTPAGSNVYRIVFDPFSRILYSTRGEEFEAVSRLVASGLSMQDSVEQVAREVFPDEYK